MQVVNPSFDIIACTPDMENVIERAARTCYKSEDKLGTSETFIQSIIKAGHHSVLEHGSVTVTLTVDRGVSHELVRHRLASYSQESTRYVNYQNREMRFIKPVHFKEASHEYLIWKASVSSSELAYKQLLDLGAMPQDARSVLPNSLATDIIMTANVREWRHVFALRCASAAHPDMRFIMKQVRDEFTNQWPVLFGDLI